MVGRGLWSRVMICPASIVLRRASFVLCRGFEIAASRASHAPRNDRGNCFVIILLTLV